MTDLAQQFADANVPVIAGRPGTQFGRVDNVKSITVESTGTPHTHSGGKDVNQTADRRPVVYVDREPRVWVLAEGPVDGRDDALVLVAAHDDDDWTDEQRDTVAVVESIMEAHYGIEDDKATQSKSKGTGRKASAKKEGTES